MSHVPLGPRPPRAAGVIVARPKGSGKPALAADGAGAEMIDGIIKALAERNRIRKP